MTVLRVVPKLSLKGVHRAGICDGQKVVRSLMLNTPA